MRTWAAITNALSWNMVSEQWTYIIKRISRNRVNQSCMANKSIDQSIKHEVKYVGPPPKPVYFARINSINLITWELRNLIWDSFLKRFKIWKIMKIACRREMAANFIKNRILEPKGNLRMKDGKYLNYLKTDV